MVYNFANEQHLEFRTHNTAWKVRDFDGIKLMMRPKAPVQTEDVLPKGFSKILYTAFRNLAMPYAAHRKCQNTLPKDPVILNRNGFF